MRTTRRHRRNKRTRRWHNRHAIYIAIGANDLSFVPSDEEWESKMRNFEIILDMMREAYPDGLARVAIGGEANE